MNTIKFWNYQCQGCARSISLEGSVDNAIISLFCTSCQKLYQFHHAGEFIRS